MKKWTSPNILLQSPADLYVIQYVYVYVMVTQHSPAVSRRPVRDSVCVCVCNEADLWFPREHARLSNDGIYMYLHTLILPTPLCTDWHT